MSKLWTVYCSRAHTGGSDLFSRPSFVPVKHPVNGCCMMLHDRVTEVRNDDSVQHAAAEHAVVSKNLRLLHRQPLRGIPAHKGTFQLCDLNAVCPGLRLADCIWFRSSTEEHTLQWLFSIFIGELLASGL